jgi:hypothetical protein
MNMHPMPGRIQSKVPPTESGKIRQVYDERFVSYGLIVVILTLVMAIQAIGWSPRWNVPGAIPTRGEVHAYKDAPASRSVRSVSSRS